MSNTGNKDNRDNKDPSFDPLYNHPGWDISLQIDTTITVGKLREMLSEFDDTEKVVVATRDLVEFSCEPITNVRRWKHGARIHLIRGDG